jgi:hypothetical protein
MSICTELSKNIMGHNGSALALAAVLFAQSYQNIIN